MATRYSPGISTFFSLYAYEVASIRPLHTHIFIERLSLKVLVHRSKVMSVRAQRNRGNTDNLLRWNPFT